MPWHSRSFKTPNPGPSLLTGRVYQKSMSVELKEVTTARNLRKFINFVYRLYKGNQYWCPQIRMNEMKTLHWKKNPAFDFCEARYWLAYRDGKVVGRIAGIINPRANERWQEKLVRFGWIDFIDDREVSAALLQVVEEWGRSKGMMGIHGPLGFTDIDNEGMLTEGFEELSTLPTIYNYPYYADHMESLGFKTAAEWIQLEIRIPPEIPEKVLRTAEIAEKRYGVKTFKARRRKDLLPYASRMFQTLNIAYNDLYGYAPLTEEQMSAYIKQYFGFIRKEFISLVVDKNDDVVGFGISLPNLTYALQKSNGRLFPFGFIHLLKALRKNEIIDLYLLGTHPDYQGKAITALFFRDLHAAYLKHGIKKAIAADQLVNNNMALSIWKNYPGRQIKKRCCWIKRYPSP